MGSRSEEYCRQAEEAEAKAEQSRDYATKKIYLDIARHWREMEAQAKRHNW
jgi:hypothetical protein